MASGFSQEFASLFKSLEASGAEIKAASFEKVGDTLIARGNFFARYKDMLLYADEAILNPTTKDVELSGRVRFYQLTTEQRDIEYFELDDLRRDPYVKVVTNGTVMSPYGRQLVDATITRETLSWSGEKAVGNFGTGLFQFGKYHTRFGIWQCVGESAKREKDGTIEIKNAVLTTCDYIGEGHETYSVHCDRVVGNPHPYSPGEQDSESPVLEKDQVNNYSFHAYNCVFYLGDTPVFWLPYMYKPPRGDKGTWGIKGGYDSNWGAFVQTTNSWRLLDDPAKIETTNLIDVYSLRGVGVGNNTILSAHDTKTELFMYGISDMNPEWKLAEDSRWEIPRWRYDLDIAHLTHVSPRMDLRARFAKVSDINFFEDFFLNRANSDPQPATYASAEYQFDRMSLSLLVRPRVNSFNAESQDLPELRLEVPRQELFKNIYYQGTTTLAGKRMSWRDFSKDRTEGNQVDPEDYEALRFDTVNFLYYPLKLDWLNVIPRAGFRFTGYGNSSDQKISDQDLRNIIMVEAPDGETDVDVVNYDKDGGALYRFIPELGVDLNTKISRKWDGAKNNFLKLDGIRHVMVPYIGYTMLFDPTANRKNIYYFDDIDRIDGQNFTRVGLENRLQTRRGSRKNPKMYTWASMNNYLDAHFKKREGYGPLGDFGTDVRFHPHEDLTISGQTLVNVGEPQINRAQLQADWEFLRGWGVFGRYNYGAGGFLPSVYSMGSSLVDLTSGSSFERFFSNCNNFTLGTNYMINDRTRGVVEFTFDAQNHLFREGRVRLVRTLPAHFDAILEYIQRRRHSSDSSGTDIEHSMVFSIELSSKPSYPIYPRESPNYQANLIERGVGQ